MASYRKPFVSAALAVTLLQPMGSAAVDHAILGKRLLVKNPTGEESGRTVVILGKEKATDVPAIAGHQLAAVLVVVVKGGSASARSFVLDGLGWKTTATGLRYRGPTMSGDPVKSVRIARTAGGVALLKIVLDGRLGSQDLDVVPPNPGDEAGVVLSLAPFPLINYCVSFGGAAGGTSGPDSAALWKVQNATAEPGCIVATAPWCCDFGNSCQWEESPGSCSAIPGAPGTVCDAATGNCLPPPATPGDCCESDLAGYCTAGPSPDDCASSGPSWFFVPDSVCLPSGDCMSP
jgi:hypothetical protein